MGKYLVINGGSSSLKFSLYEKNSEKEIEIVNGYVEKIGLDDSFYSLTSCDKKIKKKKIITNHDEAVKVMLDELFLNDFINDINEIEGVGHRVLHGGEFYSDSVKIDEEVLENIKSLIPLGPLHLPGEISAIYSMMELLPNVLQVAVFDTAFHQTIPEVNYLYAIPYNYYSNYGIRKYGFHGTSHKYITENIQKILNKNDVNVISCHIGSGASICAIKDGKSFNTTMGFTPLDGLIMGTRSGSIDASIVEYMCNQVNLSLEECMNVLNKKSGVLGISGVGSDLRDIDAAIENNNEKAKLALNMYIKSITKFIIQYCVELDGNVDAIVFTAGVGENNIKVREDVINQLSTVLNIKLNEEENNNIAKFKEKQEGVITTNDSVVPVYVIPTNEEKVILDDIIRISNKKVKTKKLV